MEQDAEADLQSERLGDYSEVDYPYKREKSVMMAYWESRLALLEMKKYGVHALMRDVYEPPQ